MARVMEAVNQYRLIRNLILSTPTTTATTPVDHLAHSCDILTKFRGQSTITKLIKHLITLKFLHQKANFLCKC